MKNIEFTKEWLHGNKVAIRCENKSEADAICAIFKGINDYSDSKIYLGVDVNEDSCYFYSENAVISYGETVIPASEVIAQYEASKRKIIGYRCPFDMFKQENDFLVNKGDLYIIAHEGSNCYAPKKWIECDLPKDIQTLYIPFEIIEKIFEPVYEEVKPCFGSLEDVLNYGKLKDTDNIVHFGSGYMSVTIGNKKEALNKENGYDFTPEFESKLKEMGINI